MTAPRVYARAPEGGWGWAVACVTMMTYAIVWGIPRGLSVLFVDFRDKFNSSNIATSWITSLIFGCFACGTHSVLCPALIGSFVTSLIGPRPTMMLGGLVSSAGLIVVSQSASLGIAYFGSAITGCGFGFAYCNATSQLGLYFDKKRALVFGIGSMGAPLGGMLLPLMLTASLTSFGLDGALLLLAGVCLHLPVGGALLRPVVIKQREHVTGRGTPVEKHELLLKRSRSFANVALSDNVSFGSTNELRNGFASENDVSALSRSPERRLRHKAALVHGGLLLRSLSEGALAADCEIAPGGGAEKNEEWEEGSGSEGSKARDGNNNKYKNVWGRMKLAWQPYRELLTSWRFMLYCLVGTLDFFARFCPTWFIVVHAQSLGYSKKQGAYLQVIFSLSDGLVKLISGYVASKMPKEKIDGGFEILGFATAQAIMAATNLMAPWARHFHGLGVYMACYAVGNALNSVWCIPIISRLVPMRHLHQGIGIFHFLSGIGILTGPPMTGYLADLTGSYDIVFYATGLVFVASVVCGAALFLLVNRYGLKKRASPT